MLRFSSDLLGCLFFMARSCSKCGHDALAINYWGIGYQSSRDSVGVEAMGKIIPSGWARLAYVAGTYGNYWIAEREFLYIQCERCKYKWAEAPEDHQDEKAEPYLWVLNADGRNYCYDTEALAMEAWISNDWALGIAIFPVFKL